MNKIIKTASLIGILAASSVSAFAASYETNVCFENQSKTPVAVTISLKPGDIAAPVNWDGGDANQPKKFMQRPVLFSGQRNCQRLEIAAGPHKAFFKVSINNGPLIYLEGWPGTQNENHWQLRYDKSPGFNEYDLIGEFYRGEQLPSATYTKAQPCKYGNSCSMFIIPEEFNRPIPE